MGYAGWIGTQGGHRDKEKNRESEIVTTLHTLGALLYCKVNSPEDGEFETKAHCCED
jgi:hypothetical protein